MSNDAYRKAIELLGRRPHFEREMRRKLLDRGFSDDECAAALERLRDSKLLDDSQCALDFIRVQLRRRPCGRRRLRMELMRRGASDDTAERAIAESDLGDELDLARDVAQLWRRRGGRDEAALMRHLDRKGFSKGDILTLVDELKNPHEKP